MKTFFLVSQTARYTFIGLLCAAANNVILILGDFVGAHYVPMVALAFAVVTPLGYLLHSSFTFGDRLSWIGLVRFTSGAAMGFPLSLLSMAILCTGLGLRVAIAAPIATVMLFLWNYASARWAIVGQSRFMRRQDTRA